MERDLPKTALGPKAKFFSKPIGWPMHLLAILAASFVVWVNRSPRVYWPNEVVAVLLWLLLLTVWSVRLFVRMLVLRWHGWSWRAATEAWPKLCIVPVLLILCAGVTNWRRTRTPHALLQAVRQGELDAAERALRGGVDVETTARWGWHDSPGESALTLAAARGDHQMMLLLFRHGADVNRADGFGNTAIIEAAQSGKSSTVQLLLNRGANPLAQGNSGTAMHVAAWGHAEVIMVLLNAGVPIDVPDKFSQTPLHYAAQAGRPDIVQFLLKRGADRNRRDNNGSTPISLARSVIIRRQRDFELYARVPDVEKVEYLRNIEPYLQVCRLLGEPYENENAVP